MMKRKVPSISCGINFDDIPEEIKTKADTQLEQLKSKTMRSINEIIKPHIEVPFRHTEIVSKENVIKCMSSLLIQFLNIGDFVYHEDLYYGQERMKITNIRELEVELEGDYSGGTNNVCQRSWMPIAGIIIQ